MNSGASEQPVHQLQLKAPQQFTGWIVLLIAQTSLIAVRRTDLHRRLGIDGGLLAGLMTVVGFFTAIGAMQNEKCMMLFGDAKVSITKLISEMKALI